MKDVAIAIALSLLLILPCAAQHPSTHPEQNTLSSLPYALPKWSLAKDQLPSPVYDEDTTLVSLYWKAWELAYKNFYLPPQGSGFVSPFIDAAFNDNIFLWDTGFMTMFCNYGYPIVPGIGSLDNFYFYQHTSGEICREIVRKTGKDFGPWTNTENETLFSRWGYNFESGPAGIVRTPVKYVGRDAPKPNPVLTLDGMNHPILAWAEWESYLLTGNKARLRKVWPALVKYYAGFEKYIRQGNGLYMTDWASMDNSERNPQLNGGGTGIDISSEMVLFARDMQKIGTLLGKEKEAADFKSKADKLSVIINRLMWDPEQQFYVDLTVDGKQAGIKTVAGYWPLLGQVASKEQASALVKHLSNPKTFGRMNPVPTLSADEKWYVPYGNYWNGSVWAPTNTMVISGLENYGYKQEAYDIAIRHLELVKQVYLRTGTIWENYSPDSLNHGLHDDGSNVVKDFVGWSGIAPIKYFIEYGIGLRSDASTNTLTWSLRSAKKTGVDNFRFNGNVITLLADEKGESDGKRVVNIESSGNFVLLINADGRSKKLLIKKGQTRLGF